MILISSGLLAWNCLQVWADRSMGPATPCTVENPAINAATTIAFIGMSFRYCRMVTVRWIAFLSIATGTAAAGSRTFRSIQIGVREKIGGCR